MQFKKDGVAPNRGKLYVKFHKKKDGIPVNEDASEKIVCVIIFFLV